MRVRAYKKIAQGRWLCPSQRCTLTQLRLQQQTQQNQGGTDRTHRNTWCHKTWHHTSYAWWPVPPPVNLTCLLCQAPGKLHVRMMGTQENHKEETGRRLPNSRYTGKQIHTDLAVAHFLPFTRREHQPSSIHGSASFWWPARKLFLISSAASPDYFGYPTRTLT